MSEHADFLLAMEMQKRLNSDANNSDSDIEEVDFKMPPSSKKPLIKFQESKHRTNFDEDYLNRTQNLVHPQWETVDPTPDVTFLFAQFDDKFFQGRLKCVSLEWSKRMYTCAGICYQRRNRFGMDITIRLSEPLLKLRPRKNLIETMLHEMIHAYCFTLNIREGNGGHGPNFKKIMYSINKVAGTNITVYHSFHDEVEVYKQHWWRCNGICQSRAPFFGYVKRTSNRAPNPNDQWWAQHIKSCGGTFMKIKEPEKKIKEKKTKSATKNENSTGSDLRKFFNPTKTVGTSSNSNTPNNIHGFEKTKKGDPRGHTKVNGGGTMLLNPKTKPPVTNTGTSTPTSNVATAFPPTSYPGLSSDPFNVDVNSRKKTGSFPPGGNLRNVVGLRDLADDGSSVGVRAASTSSNSNAMTGRGYSLSTDGDSNSSLSVDKKKEDSESVDRNHLRNIWANKFGGGSDKKRDDKNAQPSGEQPILINDDTPPPAGNSKRRRIETEPKNSIDDADLIAFVADEEKSTDNWQIIDEDVMLNDMKNEVIFLSSDSEDGESGGMPPGRARKIMSSDERQQAIKQEIMDDSINLTDADIVLIDDEYDDAVDNLTAAAELADTSVIDEFFGEDTLMEEFKRENDVVPQVSHHKDNPNTDIITCPICLGKMQRSELEEHLDGCSGVSIKIEPPKYLPQKTPASRPNTHSSSSRRGRPKRSSAKEILRNAGYTENDLANISIPSSSAEDEDDLETSAQSVTKSPEDSSVPDTVSPLTPRQSRQRDLFKTTRQCPCCGQEIEHWKLYDHLDWCPGK